MQLTNPFLKVAIEAAKAAEEVITHYYQQPVEVRHKADGSPVTIADIESEQAVKSVIRENFPHHGFFGEETGKENIDADYIWLIDPIDGTKSFIRGTPFFSTQIALRHDNKFIAGVSNAPAFHELAYAAPDEGAFLNYKAMHVSDKSRLDQATLSLGNITAIANSSSWNGLGNLIPQINRLRGYGDFMHYHLLAAGRLEAVIESDINILDIAALSVIIREAGGIFTDLQGREPGLQTKSVLAANNAEVHDRILKLLDYPGTNR